MDAEGADVNDLRFDVLDIDAAQIVEGAAVDDFSFFDKNSQHAEGLAKVVS